MANTDEEKLLDLRKRPHRTKGVSFDISMAERIRIARRTPQAIFKVASFSHGESQVKRCLSYITRQGALPLEKDTGELLTGLQAQMDLAEEWLLDSDGRRKGRDTAHLVFSMPHGASVEALRRSMQAVGAKAFSAHEWVFAIHEDRAHPHAHMMVNMRSRERGQKLQLRKGDLHRLRGLFAEAAREQGEELAASPRAARGVGEKGLRQSLYHIKQRGEKPKVEEAALKEAGQHPSPVKDTPWEKAMADRHKLEKKRYAVKAKALYQAALQEQGARRERLLKAAQELDRLAKTLPFPKTRRQALIEQTRRLSRPKPEKDLTPDLGL